MCVRVCVCVCVCVCVRVCVCVCVCVRVISINPELLIVKILHFERAKNKTSYDFLYVFFGPSSSAGCQPHPTTLLFNFFSNLSLSLSLSLFWQDLWIK